MNCCNNCGKPWHTYKHCKLPIKSVGIIHVSGDKVLMVRRKHSFGFVDFIRGNYPLHSESQVFNYLQEMTVEERECVRTMTYAMLYRVLWGSSPVGSARERIAEEKLTKLRDGVLGTPLDEMLDKCTTAWDVPEWGFPKGRLHNSESDLVGALREYEEETGFHASELTTIVNMLPLEEVFIGSNYKAYKHVYFVGFSSEPMHDRYQKDEIGAMQLFTIDDAIAAVRPYNVERLHVLQQVKALCGYPRV